MELLSVLATVSSLVVGLVLTAPVLLFLSVEAFLGALSQGDAIALAVASLVSLAIGLVLTGIIRKRRRVAAAKQE